MPVVFESRSAPGSTRKPTPKVTIGIRNGSVERVLRLNSSPKWGLFSTEKTETTEDHGADGSADGPNVRVRPSMLHSILEPLWSSVPPARSAKRELSESVGFGLQEDDHLPGFFLRGPPWSPSPQCYPTTGRHWGGIGQRGRAAATKFRPLTARVRIVCVPRQRLDRRRATPYSRGSCCREWVCRGLRLGWGVPSGQKGRPPRLER